MSPFLPSDPVLAYPGPGAAASAQSTAQEESMETVFARVLYEIFLAVEPLELLQFALPPGTEEQIARYLQDDPRIVQCTCTSECARCIQHYNAPEHPERLLPIAYIVRKHNAATPAPLANLQNIEQPQPSDSQEHHDSAADYKEDEEDEEDNSGKNQRSNLSTSTKRKKKDIHTTTTSLLLPSVNKRRKQSVHPVQPLNKITSSSLTQHPHSLTEPIPGDDPPTKLRYKSTKAARYFFLLPEHIRPRNFLSEAHALFCQTIAQAREHGIDTNTLLRAVKQPKGHHVVERLVKDQIIRKIPLSGNGIATALLVWHGFLPSVKINISLQNWQNSTPRKITPAMPSSTTDLMQQVMHTIAEMPDKIMAIRDLMMMLGDRIMQRRRVYARILKRLEMLGYVQRYKILQDGQTMACVQIVKDLNVADKRIGARMQLAAQNVNAEETADNRDVLPFLAMPLEKQVLAAVAAAGEDGITCKVRNSFPVSIAKHPCDA